MSIWRLSAWIAVSVAAASVSAACSSSASALAPVNGPLALGQWGGDSSAMMVSDTAMHIHISCTYGDVSGRVTVADGRFDVAGSYMLRAFPIAYGPAVPARFTGTVIGQTAIVTVTVNDTVAHQTVVRGPATVTLGDNPKLLPCPICRRPIVTKPSSWLDYLRGMIRRRSAAAASTRPRE